MSELPEGFALVRGVGLAITSYAELAALPWEQRSVRVYGKSHPMPRLTCAGGNSRYGYSGQTHEPAPWPDSIQRLRNEHAPHANTWLANMYRTGRDSIAWHADDEPELGDDPIVHSFSFGAPRTFQIRHNLSRQVWSIALRDGDLLVMGAGVQRAYQHAVPKRANENAPRINVTFRRVVK